MRGAWPECPMIAPSRSCAPAFLSMAGVRGRPFSVGGGGHLPPGGAPPGDPRRWLEPERVGDVLDSRKVRQILQSEPDQELPRRRVHERTPDNVLPAHDLDQMTLEKSREHA